MSLPLREYFRILFTHFNYCVDIWRRKIQALNSGVSVALGHVTKLHGFMNLDRMLPNRLNNA